MSRSQPNRSPQSLWSRFAALLSFVAVVSALLAPISVLAQEVRTGKLGALCGVSASLAKQGSGDLGGVPNAESHCSLCGSLTLAPPPLPSGAMPALPAGDQLVSLARPDVLAAAIPGLPPSRGPPAL